MVDSQSSPIPLIDVSADRAVVTALHPLTASVACMYPYQEILENRMQCYYTSIIYKCNYNIRIFIHRKADFNEEIINNR